MKLVPIGEVCTVINGGTPDTKISKFWGGQHAWITPAEMGNLKSPFLSASKRTLTDEGLSNSSAQLVPKHSVIMSSRAPIGHLVINEIPMASNQGCKALIPNKNLYFKYLYYFLYANKQHLNELGSGTTFAEISGSKLKTVIVPLPSLDKQLEIVEKLDSAFAEIDLLEENLELSDEKANQLQQSLLSASFASVEAKLELGNPSANPSLAVKLLRLRDVCVFNPPKSEARNALSTDDLVGFMPMQDLGIESISAEASSSKPLNEVIKAYTYFAENDVLIAKITPCFENGKMGIARNLVNGVGFGSSEYFVVRPKESVLSEYLYYFLRQEFVIENGRGIMTGAVGHRRVPVEYLENLEIPIPSLTRQRETIEKLDSTFGEIENFKSEIKTKKSHASTLRQSLLGSAFSLEEAVA